jgi:membrane-bound serine protease (ClpP class)
MRLRRQRAVPPGGGRVGRRPSAFPRFLTPVAVVVGLVAFLVLFALAVLPSVPQAVADTGQPHVAQAAAQPEAAAAPVWVTEAKGIIDPALASYLVKTMEDAAEARAAALVIELDTPGGLDTAMRDIIQAELDAPIPIVFYVYPQGARAASAGVYILMGSDVAAMAPQTNLGAATPVAIGGEMDEVMKAKVTNDAAAYISGLATNHERNAVWAERAVRESVSLTAEEALQQNVIEFVAPDLPALLEAMDGYVTVPKGLTLQTAGAPVEEVGMGWIQRFLHAIANPDIAYILLTVGVLGIIAEFSTPGFGGAGIGGAIALLLAFYSFQVLPVSLVGIALVVLAMILFVAEIFIQSNGVLGIGGAAALIAGGFLLFDTSASFLKVSWPVVIAVAVVALLFFLFVIMAVARARRRPVAVGAETLVGATGVAISPISPLGQVRLRGETWKARAEGEDLSRDERIEVIRTEGLTLVVRRASQSDDNGENGQDQGT